MTTWYRIAFNTLFDCNSCLMFKLSTAWIYDKTWNGLEWYNTDWSVKTWSDKHGVIKHRVIKHGVIKHGMINYIQSSLSYRTPLKDGQHRAMDKNILSSKILFTSFHLNNQTVSRRHILSSCCLVLFDLFFKVCEDGDAWYIFLVPFWTA